MKLNKVQQLAAGLAIIIVAAMITYFFMLKNDRLAIDALRQKNEGLKQDIRVARSIKQAANELEEEIRHLDTQLNRLKKVLPESVNKPKFMADIKRYANENGIEVAAISNNRPVADDVIVQHPFTYRAYGSYHDFGAFFAQLSNYSRIINVTGLDLGRRVDEEDGVGYTVSSSFLVSIFTYKEPTREELAKQIEDKRKELNENKRAK